ncbi:MAG TPA: YbhB/YbcL family Raf kinase inhibitor-like protein [Desulfobacterales bacterium]|jgi:Raf kinase inhibitor-like YbhB/YbcL family protein|nr:YbhB/YbcL family Raf kinase inhibitor-like protein [Desulfobacterales bacterium]
MKLGYGGPCPPKGTHRYFFNLYALDSALGLAPGATKKQLLKAMAGHVLAHAELMGRYQR